MLHVPIIKTGARTPHSPVHGRHGHLMRLPHPHTGPVLDLMPNNVKLVGQRMMQRAGVEDLHLFNSIHKTINRIFEKGLRIAKLVLISGHWGFRQLFRYT